MSLPRHLRAVSLGLLGLIATGCGTARYVVQEPNGGVVAIPANTAAHRVAAAELMSAQCPQGYVIDDEERVALPDRSNSNPRIGAFLNRGAEPTHEYRLTFHGQ